MRITCIVNPIAAGGNALKVWPQVEKTLSTTGWDLQVHFTEERGHATYLAAQAVRDNREVVLAAGGDGTLNEVVNGLAGTPVKLGVLPVGTGNDFARTIKMPKDPLEASVVLNRGKTLAVDLGKIGDRYFINASGVGLDAEVVLEFERRRGNTRAVWLNYFSSLLKILYRFNPRPLTIKYDGIVEEITAMQVTIANGKYFGAGMMVAPNADIADGFFNLCVVEKIAKHEFLKALPAVYRGKHGEHPAVRFIQAKKVEIISPVPVSVQMDGEYAGEVPVIIENVPGAIQVIVP